MRFALERLATPCLLSGNSLSAVRQDVKLVKLNRIHSLELYHLPEASSLLASTLGSKFSVIDLQPFTRPVIEDAVRSAGLLDKLTSIRSPEGLTAAKSFKMTFGGEQEKLTELPTGEIAKAVKEDGAEALFVLCVITSALLTMQGVREVEGAPVIEQVATSLKIAEILLDLKRAYGTGVCRKSIYLTPSAGWDTQMPIRAD